MIQGNSEKRSSISANSEVGNRVILKKGLQFLKKVLVPNVKVCSLRYSEKRSSISQKSACTQCEGVFLAYSEKKVSISQKKGVFRLFLKEPSEMSQMEKKLKW
jgi:hypothetical protein